MNNRYSNRNDCSPAFTLVELMVVLVIIGILSALVMGALRGAQQDTLAAKTRGTIAKIDAVLNERFDEYLTKPLKFAEPTMPNFRDRFPTENRVRASSISKVARMDPMVPAGIFRERTRLAATRDLMRLEMPDCVGDIFATGYLSTITFPMLISNVGGQLKAPVTIATGYRIGPVANPLTPGGVPLLMRMEPSHQFRRIVERVLLADKRLASQGRQRIDPDTGLVYATLQPIRWADTYSNEELLYMIVEDSFVDGSPAIEAFGLSEIGDKDDDGLKEFLDAWGNPIRWIRWPAGAATTTPLNPDPLLIGGAPQTDPFDPTFADIGFDPVNAGNPFAPPGNGLRPLVVSAGPDGRFGIRFYAIDPASVASTPVASPIFSPSSVSVTGASTPQRPAYWTASPLNWPDPYWPRAFPNARRGAVLNLIIDTISDPIGVDLNVATPTFLPHPNTDNRYLLHSEDNVTNLDESGAST